MLFVALIFPVALLVVAMLLSRLESWMDGPPVPTRRVVSPVPEDADALPRGEQSWVHGIKEGAAR
jgi:hypothetical protein